MNTSEHEQQRRRGRPLKPEADRKSATVKFRITEELRSQLEAASEKSGRPLSDEAETRLRNSFLLEPFHELVFQNGDSLRFLVNSLLTAIKTIQDYSDNAGHQGTQNWGKFDENDAQDWNRTEGTRAAIRAAAGLILQHAAPLSPPSDINEPPGKRSLETEGILWMRELGREVGLNWTGQVQSIVDMMMRQNDAKYLNTENHD